MPGKPKIDITVVTKNLLPDIKPEIIKELQEIGFVYCGPAPHSMDKNKDHWFHKVNNYKDFE